MIPGATVRRLADGSRYEVKLHMKVTNGDLLRGFQDDGAAFDLSVACCGGIGLFIGQAIADRLEYSA